MSLGKWFKYFVIKAMFGIFGPWKDFGQNTWNSKDKNER